MPLQMTELFDSRDTTHEVGKSSLDLRYKVWETEDDLEVEAFLDANLPDSYATLPLQGFRKKHEGGGIWLVVARYANEVPREVGDFSETFEISSGSRNIKQSIQTVHRGKVDGVTTEPPDFKGAIEVTEGGVNGVDVYSAQFTFSLTYQFEDSTITSEYRNNLARMTPSVNNDSFKGFAAGEVLFLGANGSQRNGLEWEITFRFAVQLNQTDIVFEGSEPFGKDGWDYFWVAYKRNTDQGRYVRQAEFFYVERVYDRADFSTLGIGV